MSPDTSTDKQTIPQEMRAFAGDGRMVLPESYDAHLKFDLHWDCHTTTSHDSSIPHGFLETCANSMVASLPVAESMTVVFEPGLASNELQHVPDLAKDKFSNGPLSGGYHGRRVDSIREESHLSLVVKEAEQELNDSEHHLATTTASKSVINHLLRGLAAQLNAQATQSIMKYAMAVSENHLDDVIRKCGSSSYQSQMRFNAVFNHNVKVMAHPEVCKLIASMENHPHHLDRTNTGIEVIGNWSMPPPGGVGPEVLVGDFSQALLLLSPIEITISLTQVGWEFKATTLAGCGIWSLGGGSIVKARLPI